MTCEAVILAAGLGTRMKSARPKVLHTLGGKPLLGWVIEAVTESLGRAPWIVVGPEADELRAAVGEGGRFVVQEERLGTGHAVLQAAGEFGEGVERILVASADMPLISADTMRRLRETQENHDGPFTLLTVESETARGFGRVVRDTEGNILEIVEAAHASPDQLAIRELNVGAYCFDAEWLWAHLPELPLSPKGEYYLTDLVAAAAAEGRSAAAVSVEDPIEAIGINTRAHLAQAETALRARVNRRWMEAGVTMLDPETTYIGLEVEIGPDTEILPNTILEGRTQIGEGCVIGPNTVVHDSEIGDRCQIQASVLEGATLEAEVLIGPFAHLRPGAHLERGVHMGNFGEVKNSRLKRGVRMGHFSYIGDATIGEAVNIGAGTITCNYDGEQKHHTDIEAGAFIGSDTMLVAPVRIGRRARTGAGAVVTKDVPDHAVAVGVPARVIRKLKPEDE